MADIFVRDANLVYLMEKTGYNITQENGQRKFGPPPGWIGPPPPKGSEIFIKKLPRDVYEDELVPLCEQFGKIYELRLMVDFNGENRGYSFVTYTNVDDATNAIKHLDDYEIRPGRHIGVCKSIDNSRLFVGGIPKDKSKEEIMAEISKYTEGASKVILYSSIVDKSKNRGFAFVEYETHREAAMARNTLLQSNIRLFDKKIAVDFAYPEGDVEDEMMKRVYFKFPLPPPPRPPKAVLEYLYQHTLASSVNYRSAPRVFMEQSANTRPLRTMKNLDYSTQTLASSVNYRSAPRVFMEQSANTRPLRTMKNLDYSTQTLASSVNYRSAPRVFMEQSANTRPLRTMKNLDYSTQTLASSVNYRSAPRVFMEQSANTRPLRTMKNLDYSTQTLASSVNYRSAPRVFMEQSANTRPLRTMKNLDYSTQDIAQQESPAFEEEHIFQSMPMIRQEEARAVTSISPSSSSSSLLSTKWTYKGFRWIKKTKGAVQKKECLVKHKKLIDYDQGSYFPRMTSSESSLELSTVANFECDNDKTKSGNQSTPLKKIKAEMCCINCKKQKNNHHDLVFINLECFHSMCKDCANWKFSVHNKERPLRCDKCFQEIRKIKNRVIK